MNCILNYFTALNPKQHQQFEQLHDLYSDWNMKINVISRKDISFLYEKHVLHSLGIAKVLAFNPGARVLDVGTGGGFPGIPLAILFPDTEFLLVDVIAKKIRVVQEVVNALGLKNVTAIQKRAGTFDTKFDFIVSRAVTNMTDFVGWTRSNFSEKHTHSMPNGILYLKGGDLTEELANFPAAICYPLSEYFTESFFETKQVVYLPIKKSSLII